MSQLMNMLMSVITTDTAMNGDVGERRVAPVRPGDSQVLEPVAVPVSVRGGVSYQATVIRGGGLSIVYVVCCIVVTS